MRVLVTGGAGAIGSHLVALLLEGGHEVTVIDDLSSGRAELVPEGARLVEGSILDERCIEDAFADGPEAVAHLAALFANQNSVEHPRDDLLVNGLGTLTILERSVAAAVRKVLVVSSSCAYVSRPVLVEDDPVLSVDTPYAITKALGESYARYFAEHHSLDTVIVRPFNGYGPHEHPGRYRNVIANFVAAALRGEPLPITGTGDETRDFTYVGDLAAGMAAALLRPTQPGSVFNLASGRSVRIADVAAMVNDAAGSRGGVRHLARRSWDRTDQRVASIARAQEILGYRPEVGLEDGIRRTVEWQRGLHG